MYANVVQVAGLVSIQHEDISVTARLVVIVGNSEVQDKNSHASLVRSGR